jgi:protein tyrosine/serine phosphatase
MHSSYSLRRRTAALCSIAAFIAVSALASSDSNLPNFRKVNDQVYRGGQPNDDGFKELLNLGIKTIIDLRQIGEHSQAEEEKLVNGLGMRFVSVPMKGMSTPQDEQVAEVLSLLTNSSAGPVFVHCKRGADRTGAVIAAYRIAHDRWENSKALSEAKADGMSFFERAIQHYVMDYKANSGQVAAASSPSVAQAHLSAP